ACAGMTAAGGETATASPFSVILTKVRIQRRSTAREAQQTSLDPGLRRDDGGGWRDSRRIRFSPSS
ncbi:hypothetical protein, partial [Herbaspirillum robiniae]|uniref:hypothetical protein n=1 Tax=Herbaspirillum robiniae TaxID=2014887 RepID=UPI001A9CABB1